MPGPEPFSAYTTPEFWDDPHISAQMLRHHLDPDSDASSRSHAFIERSVVWLVGLLSLREGSRVLDLGCGPGLYALGLARLGARVVGVDVSRRSLGHLLEASAAENLPIETVHGSYLEADLDGPHDAAILIYEDYCAQPRPAPPTADPGTRGAATRRSAGLRRHGGARVRQSLGGRSGVRRHRHPLLGARPLSRRTRDLDLPGDSPRPE